MTHFYGTEEELKLWLAQKTERALASAALNQGIDITDMSFEEFKNHTLLAKV